jgi:hypothetical protein
MNACAKSHMLNRAVRRTWSFRADPGVSTRMQDDNSPLAVAFEEPVLRNAGLQDETFG